MSPRPRLLSPSLLPIILLLTGGLAGGCAHPKESFVDVDANGHRLHLLVISDSRKKPTVVLESGAGGGIGWQNTRSQIARFARVVTYDRAGIGDSAPGPDPRDARSIARDLRAALHSAHIDPPYVLVGQSLGGLYVQVFAAEYPDETAGLVLVDPTHASADLCLSIDEVKSWYMTHRPEDWPRVESACGNMPGGLRSFLACKYKLMETFIESVPEPRQSEMRRDWWTMVDRLIGDNPQWNVTGGTHQEAMAAADSIHQAIAARPLPRIPIILLAAGKTDLYAIPQEGVTPNMRELQKESRRWRRDAYQQWIDETPGAHLRIVEGSGHDIESDRPNAVIDAVREVVR